MRVYGPQGWWPGGGGFEIFAGALLVQRTSWLNAESAIESLRATGLLSPERLAQAPLARIEETIRCCGFYATKARRLSRLAGWFVGAGGLESLAARQTRVLRDELLALEGIGPETADAILLYAFGRPVVVVDEYLRRLLQRVSGMQRAMPDGQLRDWVIRQIDDADGLNEFHALVVAHGKHSCRKQPDCDRCRLRDLCRTGRESSDA